MSMTLNLIDRLLARGRTLQRLGRDRDALRLFRRLAQFRELPAAAAEEAQARLAEIQLDRRRYHRARRHLAAALRHQPDSARYHYLLATAVAAEDTGDPRRAAQHYRRSLQLDPRQPACLIDYGQLNIREGRLEAGLTCLRRAVELAPENVHAVRCLAEGLVKARRFEEARSVLRLALFRNPRDGRFRQLANDFQFRQAARTQKAERRARGKQTVADGPVLLPFRRPLRTEPRCSEAHVIRQDSPTPLPPPHGPRPSSRQPDQRQAQ
jgi:tetratricopeptide (TPR) repeat protein